MALRDIADRDGMDDDVFLRAGEEVENASALGVVFAVRENRDGAPWGMFLLARGRGFNRRVEGRPQVGPTRFD